jgi:NADPH:quinone reductase-like Zn-dependent oxidoreductase
VLAKQRGIRTVNVVRRAGLADELKALGADVVIVDGDDLPMRVREATGGGTIRLAIDAVGGAATARLAECVANDGTVVHYGSMSGEDPQMPRAALVYRGVTITGFMLGRGLAKHSAAEIREIYAGLAAQIVAGTLVAPVDTIYPIEDIKAALAHADRGGRNGKILVTPNGPI